MDEVGHGTQPVDRRAAAAPNGPLRSTVLPDGRVLELVALGPQHVDGLVALYDSLSDDDLRRRFFSTFHPRRAFLEHWAALHERGGGGLVAIVHAPGDGPAVPGGDGGEIVADAGFVPLPDGNAELAMTVGPGWRGWLGPYLLDALVELAAAAGVETLEAEVLASNGPMLSLLRGRGAAVAAHPDWTSLRLVIGTSCRVPSWPPHDNRPRLLVEGAGSRWAGEAAATRAGYDVVTCPGPGRDPRHCPLLQGGTCPLVQGADAVLVVVRPDQTLGADLLDRLAEDPPRARVVVEVQQPGGASSVPPQATVFEGCTPSAALIAAIDAALDRNDGGS